MASVGRTTADFCGDNKVKSPSCDGTSSNQRTIGYYEGWNLGRPCGTMEPEDIPSGAYTHINFAFAFIDPTSYKIAPMADDQVDLYRRVTGLKDFQPGLEVWISVGGWSMNDPDQPTHATFSELAASEDAQNAFFGSLISFMETYGFDGVDIDWEYPVAEERSGKPDDYKNYVTFLQNLRKAFGASGHKYGLTITIPSSYWYLRHFDIVNIAKTIDWFNLMSYDLHGTWDSTVKSIGSVVNAHTNLTEIEQSLELLWRNDIDPGQVVLGLGFYGRSFTLKDPSCTAPGCPFSGGGTPGECTANSGTLSYDEISDVIAAGATVTLDKDAAIKQVTWGSDQWVSYDDTETLAMKIDYANKHCLGGTMVWAVSLDTRGGAAGALSDTTKRQQMSQQPILITDNSRSCFITECQDRPICPFASGFGAVQQINGDRQDVIIGHGCAKGQSRTYCCPTNDMPTCAWKGNAPSCGIKGKCASGEVEVTYDTGGCSTGHKVLCCGETKGNEARSKCIWKGTAPVCRNDNGCPADHPKEVASSPLGDNQKPCDFNLDPRNTKRFCCEDPAPYENCQWYNHGDTVDSTWKKCDGRCPVGKQLVATDDYCFFGGTRELCCDQPSTINDGPVDKFRKDLQNIHDNLPCKAGDLPTKRDLETPASLLKRDLSPALSDTIRVLLNSRHQESFKQNLYMQVYDKVWEDQGFNTSAFNSYIDNVDQEVDPIARATEALCGGSDSSAELSCVLETQEQLCELPASPFRRSLFSRTADWLLDRLPVLNLAKRRFTPDFDSAAIPAGKKAINSPTKVAAARIIDAVIRDEVPLLYMAQLAYEADPNRRGYRGFSDVEMEVVFDIRGRPDLQEFEGQDNFAVFHFHTQGFVNEGGTEYPAIVDALVYHAQTVFQNDILPHATHDWVADFRDFNRINQRTGLFQCPRSRYQQTAILAGNPHNIRVAQDSTGRPRECVQRIQDLTNELYRRGILTRAAYTTWDGHQWTMTDGNAHNQGPNGGPPPTDMGDPQFPRSRPRNP
ncbi:putative glycosyl hydrolases family 18 protein 1 [Elsinoe fawcettii]|nr:putative glycosyl hydrolases family 18 protein 1 [Elsinoe fawcettii]